MAELRRDPQADLRRVLACAAVCPALGSVVLYDLAPAEIDRVAAEFQALLVEAGAGTVDHVRLGPAQTDDDLYGFGEGLPPEWRRPGLLGPADPGHTRLVIIPQLARLSLAAARACVAMIGAEEGHLQRHGQDRVFRPRLRWLAACPAEDLGQVSPHLLDRFAVRILAPPAPPEDRVAALARRLDDRGEAPSTPGPWRPGALRAAAARRPRFSDEALEEVLRAIPPGSSPGVRRELALARAGLALARMEGAREVAPAHVLEAIRLLDMRPRVEQGPRAPLAAPSVAPAKPTAAQETPLASAPLGSLPLGPADGASPTPAPEGAPEITPPEALPPVQLPPDELERAAPVQREHASLRLPAHHARTSARGRGPVIGVRASSTLEDFAPASTLFAAAPHQRRRRELAGAGDSRRILLRRADLRAYRRAPIAEELFVLLLDHTALAGRDWESPLVPLLSQAYVERARVCLVQVGAEGADPVRAERLEVRSLLVPALGAALDRAPGRSTPLADGLALALASIRGAISHGRSAVRRVRFVVLTDGRGNVPLEASRKGRLTGRVGREGIDDALQVAREIGAVEQVQSVLLDPCPALLPTLPRALAKALRAHVVPLAAESS